MTQRNCSRLSRRGLPHICVFRLVEFCQVIASLNLRRSTSQTRKERTAQRLLQRIVQTRQGATSFYVLVVYSKCKPNLHYFFIEVVWTCLNGILVWDRTQPSLVPVAQYCTSTRWATRRGHLCGFGGTKERRIPRGRFSIGRFYLWKHKGVWKTLAARNKIGQM